MVYFNPSSVTVSILVNPSDVATSIRDVNYPPQVLVGEVFSISGRLVRLDTLEGIPGMVIKLFKGSTQIGQSNTDALGAFAFNVSEIEAGNFNYDINFEGAEGVFGAASRTLGIISGAVPSNLLIPVLAVAVPSVYLMLRR